MDFISTQFAVSFIVFYLIYWLLAKNYKIQNGFLLLANYVFYALINWKFCFLLLFSSLLTYLVGLALDRYGNKKIRKVLLVGSIIIYVGLLFVFKYYNFFASEFARVIGFDPDKVFISLIMPVGISFYTFNIIGYTVDVYRRYTESTKEIIPFLTYVSFFPLLMSGPIERSKGLLPQFKKIRNFNYGLNCDGLQQLIFGVFKKVVIANNCALIVNNAFGNYENLPASSLALGAILYSIQIYFDFSGYSDMAIGLSKLLGFKVRPNFHFPYFSLNVADFWRRWHMSLQSWFTDYIYIPLGGSRRSKWRVVLNTMIVFLICGIWHGANWTFVAWGIYHGLLFLPLILFFSKEFRKRKVNEDKIFPSISEMGFMVLTFILITIGWIIFNAPTISIAIDYIRNIFSISLLSAPIGIGLKEFGFIAILIMILFGVEWTQRDKEYALQIKTKGWVKVLILYVLVACIIFCNATQTDFIYYQF